MKKKADSLNLESTSIHKLPEHSHPYCSITNNQQIAPVSDSLISRDYHSMYIQYVTASSIVRRTSAEDAKIQRSKDVEL